MLAGSIMPLPRTAPRVNDKWHDSAPPGSNSVWFSHMPSADTHRDLRLWIDRRSILLVHLFLWQFRTMFIFSDAQFPLIWVGLKACEWISCSQINSGSRRITSPLYVKLSHGTILRPVSFLSFFPSRIGSWLPRGWTSVFFKFFTTIVCSYTEDVRCHQVALNIKTTRLPCPTIRWIYLQRNSYSGRLFPNS